MNKDDRYGKTRILIESGHITELRDVFDDFTLSVVAIELGMRYQRFLYLLKRPRSLKVDDIQTIARLLKVDERKVFDLIMNQLENPKPPKKKK